MATEFDENEFLEDLLTYMDTQLSAIDSTISVHVVDTYDLGDVIYDSLEPPFVAIKDGNAVNVMKNECEVNYSLPVLAVVKTQDEAGGAVYGRAPKATYYGVVQLVQYLRRIFKNDYIRDNTNGLDMTSQRVDVVYWDTSEASEPFRGGDAGHNIFWQSKLINIHFQLRKL